MAVGEVTSSSAVMKLESNPALVSALLCLPSSPQGQREPTSEWSLATGTDSGIPPKHPVQSLQVHLVSSREQTPVPHGWSRAQSNVQPAAKASSLRAIAKRHSWMNPVTLWQEAAQEELVWRAPSPEQR